jgi:hypothetical protein
MFDLGDVASFFSLKQKGQLAGYLRAVREPLLRGRGG